MADHWLYENLALSVSRFKIAKSTFNCYYFIKIMMELTYSINIVALGLVEFLWDAIPRVPDYLQHMFLDCM